MITAGISIKMIPSGKKLINFQPAISKKTEVKNPQEEKVIKIGLLLPNPPDQDPLALAAKQGAELAIMQANEIGGFDGKSFKIVIRTANGLWGAGSKESVKFIFEDEVVAIITALDGRNAHLAEQVAAKSHIVQLATRATDETLSQAFVPWFFRIVPNDKQQAEALIEEIYYKRSLRKLYVIYEDEYDHKMAAETFKRIAIKKDLELIGFRSYSSTSSNTTVNSIHNYTQAIIFFGSYNLARPVLDNIKMANSEVQIFGPLSMTADGLIGSGFSTGCEGGIFVSSKFCFTTHGQEFKNIFLDTYENMPNPAASYTYDGVKLIIEAIRKAGTDRDKIRDVLADIEYSNGATGPIQFDDHGNRTSPVFMIQMIKGHPVILHR